MTRILITGAGGSAAHNFVESLRLAGGYTCSGTDMRPEHLELIELSGRYVIPPVTSPEYLGALNAVIERNAIDFVHPQPDVEVAALAAHRADLAADTLLPSVEVITGCQDKMTLAETLKQASVPVPDAVHVTSKASLREAMTRLRRNSNKVWLRAKSGAGSRGSLPVHTFYQGDAWIEYWHDFQGLDYGDFMASEFLPGREYAWQSLWYRGELVTSMARERLEYIFGNHTPSGQTSSPSIARTVHSEPVNATGTAAVRAADPAPHGVYCVDMKEDADGVPKVTEINVGRFFTTSNFFAQAGLNMPDLYVRLGTGRPLPERPSQYNPLPSGLYWVRMVDMGYALVEEDAWRSEKISTASSSIMTAR